MTPETFHCGVCLSCVLLVVPTSVLAQPANVPALPQIGESTGETMKADPDSQESTSGKLGVTVLPTNGPGLIVAAVEPGSPAATAGIRAGDYIVSVNQQIVSSQPQLSDAIRSHKPGDSVDIATWRAGNEIRLQVTLAAATTPATPTSEGWLGMVVRDDAPDKVAVASVVVGGPAQTAGIRAGDVLTSIKGTAVTSAAQLAATVRETPVHAEIAVTVQRGEQTYEYQLQIGESRTDHSSFFRGPLDNDGFVWPPPLPPDLYYSPYWFRPPPHVYPGRPGRNWLHPRRPDAGVKFAPDRTGV